MESTILEFDRVYYEKYDTSSIIIRNGSLISKEVKMNCEILKIDDKTKYGYRKAVIQLDDCIRLLMVNWETQINNYLKGEGIPPIKIVYGNKIYPKTKINNPAKASIIEIKSV